MNINLPHVPERPKKPRNNGITMVMDKGISLNQAGNFIETSSEFVDVVKLGFGTSVITNKLEEKIKLYQNAGMKVYLGGTLFEAFIIRDMLDDYLKWIDKLKLDTVEISDGSIIMNHDKKCQLIKKISKNFTVLSEVGSKEEGMIIHPNKWVSMMNAELQAGAWKVIAEARESGTVGIYRPSGHAHTILVNKILTKVKAENILWETPQKSQQVWFLKLLGANANLGNIGYEEVIPLETLRMGLRGDTFFTFLPKKISKNI